MDHTLPDSLAAPFSRQHTFQATRLLFRAHKDPSLNPGLVADLVDDVLAERFDLKERDVDGSTVVSLALREWDGWRQDLGTLQAPPGFSRYPLPGEEAHLHDPRYIHDWQQPAAALIWKGADPFEQWPHETHVAWSQQEWEHRLPKCGVLAAIRYKAWDVVDLCLRLPNCPAPGEFDKIIAGDGEGLLHTAVDDVQAMRMLLRHGLDPNVVDSRGRTPLFTAGSVEVVQELLEAGADPHHVDHDGNDAPTCWAYMSRDAQALIKTWREHSKTKPVNANGRMVVQAVQGNSWKMVREALKASAWSPDQPVDPSVHPTRRLPQEASLRMLATAKNAGSAIPVTPLFKILTEPDLAPLWTDEEKAWVACSLLLIKGLNLAGVALSSGTIKRTETSLHVLLQDPHVCEKISASFGEIMGQLPNSMDYWVGWLSQIPLDVPGVGTNPSLGALDSLAFLDGQPDFVLEFLARKKISQWASPKSKMARAKFLGAGEPALRAYGRMRALAHPHSGDLLSGLDEAWRQAWDDLPGRPALGDLAETLKSFLPPSGEKGETNIWAQKWEAWLHAHQMRHTLPQKRARGFAPSRL